LDIFEKLRTGKKGAPTDEEQDLLRAMLLFAASCLDAVVKHLIQDSLEIVTSGDVGAHKQFETYVERRQKKVPIEGDNALTAGTLDVKFLAVALSSRNPWPLLVDDLIGNLKRDSLQSGDQLLRVASHFAITRDEIMPDPKLIREIFAARNEITHEMDIDFEQPNRSRRPRRLADMTRYVNQLFRVSSLFVSAVAKKIPAAEAP
jgi:hypothetical protein